VSDVGRAPRLHGPIGWDVVPASGGGTRSLARLDDRDASHFRNLVARVSSPVERRLGPGVLANRCALSRGPSMLAPWRPAWRTWQASIRSGVAAGAPWTHVVVTDVRECFGSIRPEIVERSLVSTGARADDAMAIGAYLRALAPSGVRGLPIGPEPSAVIANAVLAELDDAAVGAGCMVLRWVDDLVVFAPAASAARAALDDVERAAERVGLQLHVGKTRMFSDREQARSALLGRDASGGKSACMA
jgi:hypothetical protein